MTRRYIALLRAINVGGRAIISMDDLRAAFRAAGCANVTTHIQSGNVIFECAAQDPQVILGRVGSRLRDVLGNDPGIALRTPEEMEELVRRAPFPTLEAARRARLFAVFLLRAPQSPPDLPLISSKDGVEVIGMTGLDVFAVSRPKPNGSFGFPNAFVEARFGVPATSRNWSTVTRLVQLARAGL